MMQRPLVLLWLAMSLTLATAASAQDPKVGKLDGERVFKEYKLYQQLNEELQAMGRTLITQYDVRKAQVPAAAGRRVQPAGRICRSGWPPSARRRRPTLDRLQKLSDERDRELAELEGSSSSTRSRTNAGQELQRYGPRRPDVAGPVGAVSEAGRGTGPGHRDQAHGRDPHAVEEVAKEAGADRRAAGPRSWSSAASTSPRCAPSKALNARPAPPAWPSPAPAAGGAARN